jgi:hypothetical protein
LSIGSFAQNDQAALRSVRRLSEAEPSRQWDKIGVLDGYISQVEHNCRKSTSLQQQIRCTNSLIQTGPWLVVSGMEFLVCPR